MRLGLIAMSGVRVKSEELRALGVSLPQFVERGEVIASLPSLGLLTVAGLTPEDVDVEYREIAELDLEAELEEFDLVAISSFTAQIREAYALADRYRATGVPVVLGGLHVSMLPQEASEHADAIVLWGAEGAWPRLVEDFRQGRLQPRYEGLRSGVFEEAHVATPRFDLLRGRPYDRVTVQTSRGCPWDCEFCAASLRITSRYQQKPVDRAIAEIEAAVRQVERPFLELADDNSFVDHRWSKQFLRELAPLDLKWFTETDISVADDPELLDLLAASGCRQVLIGLESPTPWSLEGIDRANFKASRAARALESIDALQSRGITVNGCLVLGLDHDGPEVFEQVLDFVDRSRLLEVQLTVMTPFPGTPLYARLQQEGRLLREADWDRCTLFDVTYRPARMSVEQLEEGLQGLFREVYSDGRRALRRRHYLDLAHQRGISSESMPAPRMAR